MANSASSVSSVCCGFICVVTKGFCLNFLISLDGKQLQFQLDVDGKLREGLQQRIGAKQINSNML